jgi:hypothetical protein
VRVVVAPSQVARDFMAEADLIIAINTARYADGDGMILLLYG